MKQCPKCGHERRPGEAGAAGICPACGLVFAKWARHTLGTETLPRDREPDLEGGGRLREVLALAVQVPPATDPWHFRGRVAVGVLLLVWGAYFILLDFRTAEIGNSFMHRVNLVFHEAGHVLFMPFGRFMAILGGTLGQLLMPVVVMGAFLWKNRDPFGGSVGLWWLGQSFMDCAPYIDDARRLQMPLVGGGTGADRPGVHDWENILLDLGLIEHERAVAALFDGIGTVLMLAAFAWGGYVLLLQYRNLPGK